MSLIMTVYLNDGILMASDSRTTLTISQTQGSQTTNNIFPFSDLTFKSFLAPNNCGIATCGDSSYLNKPISGYIEKFLAKNIQKTTSVFDLANDITNYFSSLDVTKTTIFHVCGYELNPTTNEYDAKFYWCQTGTNQTVTLINTTNQGAKWDGEIITLSKLLLTSIVNPEIIEVPNLQLTIGTNITQIDSYVLDKNKTTIIEASSIPWNLMSINDGVEFITFAFDITMKNMKFQSVSKTVGGPVDILAVKPIKSKWIKRKPSN